MLLLLWGTLVASAQDCPNPEWIANQAEEYVLNFVLEDATAALRKAEEAYACAGPADPKIVARLLGAEGTIALLQGRAADALGPYATARAIAPEVWKADYGDEARGLWASAVVSGTGHVELLGVLGRHDVWVDGSLQKSPVEVPAGPHLVQVGYKGEDPGFARWVVIRSGETTSLYVALSEPEVAGDLTGEPIPTIQPPKRSTGLLWGGVGLAAVGTAVGTTTWAMNRDPDAVVTEGYEAGMKAANVAGWGLAGVGAGLGVAGAVIATKTGGVVPTGRGVLFVGRFK